MSALIFSIKLPFPPKRVVETMCRASCGCSVIILITPAIASEPYREEAAPLSTSIRFTLPMSIRERSTYPETSPVIFFPFTRIRIYSPFIPLSVMFVPMAVGLKLNEGFNITRASSIVEIPLFLMSEAVMTSMGTGEPFNLLWVVPETTTWSSLISDVFS